MTNRTLTEELERHAKIVMPDYPNDVCSRAKREIDRLRAALKPFAEAHAMGDNYVRFAPRLIEAARAAYEQSVRGEKA
jgi:hypothetical protein